MISCHCFLLMTSTRPPRIVTRLYNSQRSNTCLAIIGRRLMGVPRAKHSIRNMMATTEIPCIFIIRFSRIQDCCCCCMVLPGWTSRQSDTTWHMARPMYQKCEKGLFISNGVIHYLFKLQQQKGIRIYSNTRGALAHRSSPNSSGDKFCKEDPSISELGLGVDKSTIATFK